MASRNKQNNVHPTSMFTPVRSADSSFETVLCVKCKQWRIYWVNQCNMPSDSHNILQIHHRLFTSMNNPCLDRYPSDRYPYYSTRTSVALALSIGSCSRLGERQLVELKTQCKRGWNTWCGIWCAISKRGRGEFIFYRTLSVAYH